jgi:lipopolysaccharide export LptBFGC system permease protein LptF
MKPLKRSILLLVPIIIITFIVILIINNIVVPEHMPKERIISAFKKNSVEFNVIVKYINGMDGLFSFYYDYDKNTYISKNKLDDSEAEIRIDNSDVQNYLIYLIEELDFRYILEGKDYILFIQEHSPYEQGIMFLKNDLKSGGFNEEVYIDDNWYYYLKTYE